MKKIVATVLVLPFLLMLFSYVANQNSMKYKCLIQMKNYSGEGAYIVISIINPEGDYEKTVYVQGDDPEWYYEITSWWKFYGKKRNKLPKNISIPKFPKISETKHTVALKRIVEKKFPKHPGNPKILSCAVS